MGTGFHICLGAICACGAVVAAPIGCLEKFVPGCVTVSGEIGHRMDVTIDKMLHHTDIENTFAKHFRIRKEKPDEPGGFAGYGMFLDALVKAAAHGIGGEETVRTKTRLLRELGEMQTPDGRISMFSGDPGFWDNHEGAYMIQALCLDHRWFGTDSSLATARKLADSLIAHDSFPTLGSETAYLLLYEETRERKYLEWLEKVAFIADDIDTYDSKVKVNGVQHVYTWLARALSQLQYADAIQASPSARIRLSAAASEAVRRARGEYMSVTGSITGTPHWGELWDTTQVGLGKWGETCASAYLIRLLATMMKNAPQAEYGDLIERVMYNAFFSAQSSDGLKYRYWTPFNERAPWYDRDTYCCPNNYKREVFELPDAVFFKMPNGLAVNLFTEATLNAEGISARMVTTYPDEGHMALDVRMTGRHLRIRIPGWCEGATVSVAGGLPMATASGWFDVERDFTSSVRVDVNLPMPIRLVSGTHAQVGRVAVLRGPCVYALASGNEKGAAQDVDLWDLDASEELVWNAEKKTIDVELRSRNLRRERRKFSLTRYSADVHDRTYFDVVDQNLNFLK